MINKTKNTKSKNTKDTKQKNHKKTKDSQFRKPERRKRRGKRRKRNGKRNGSPVVSGALCKAKKWLVGPGRCGKFSRSGYVSVEVSWHRGVRPSSGFGNWYYGIASRCLRWCQCEDGLSLMYWSPVYMVYGS